VRSNEKTLLDAFPDPIIISFADGRVDGWNAAAEQLFGPIPDVTRVEDLLPFLSRKTGSAKKTGSAANRTWQGLVSDATGRQVHVAVNRATIETLMARRGSSTCSTTYHSLSSPTGGGSRSSTLWRTRSGDHSPS
jgi:hypothetical protein